MRSAALGKRETTDLGSPGVLPSIKPEGLNTFGGSLKKHIASASVAASFDFLPGAFWQLLQAGKAMTRSSAFMACSCR